MSKKIDFSKLTLSEIAALDCKGDLRVKSRVQAGVAGTVHGGTQGVAPPPTKLS